MLIRAAHISDYILCALTAMDPFVYLPLHRVVACKVCCYAVVGNEAAAHLRNQHGNIKPKERKAIVAAVQLAPGIIPDQTTLKAKFQFPPPLALPTPHLGPPATDGLQCCQCPYISRQLQKIQSHCRDKHGWINTWEKGGHVAKKAKLERDVPWKIGVLCQRIFRSGHFKGWFEVRPGDVAGLSAPNSAKQQILALHLHAQRCLGAEGAQLVEADQEAEPNLWLRRVGWAQHLQGHDRKFLQGLVAIPQKGEEELYLICRAFDRLMNQGQAVSVQSKVGLAVLFELNRSDQASKPSRPFDGRMEANAWERYKRVWMQLFCFMIRTEVEPDGDQDLPHCLTKRQGDAINEVLLQADRAVQLGFDGVVVALERACLNMVMAVLDHQFDSPYKSVLITGLAVLGLREDGGWETPLNYT